VVITSSPNNWLGRSQARAFGRSRREWIIAKECLRSSPAKQAVAHPYR
jgi:hypothetical protein